MISKFRITICSLIILFSASVCFADIVINILVVNGTDISREKEVFQHLPKELKLEDIVDADGLDVDFDVTKGQHVVKGLVTLPPKESKTFRVKVRDIWKIDQEEITEIRDQIDANAKIVEGTEYEETANVKKEALKKRLDFILEEQRKVQDSASARIDRYRTYATELSDIRNNAVSVKYWRSKLPEAIEENIFKLVLQAENPSADKPSSVEQKHYLPEEVKPEHLVDYEGFQIKYDAIRGQSYLSRTEELQPSEIKRYEVGILDIWRINQADIDDIKVRTNKTFKLLEPTEYVQNAEFLTKNIKEATEEIERSQAIEKNINQHIRAFRENEYLFAQAKKDIESLEELLEAVRETLVRSRMQNVLKRIGSLKGFSDVADALMNNQPTNEKAWVYILFIMGFVGAITLIAFAIWGKRSKDVEIVDTEENLAAKEEAGIKPKE